MGKYLGSLMGLLVLVGGLGTALVLVQESQDIRKKAAGADVTTSKIVELATRLGDTSGSGVVAYKSDLLGYSVRINKDLWVEDKGTDLAQSDLSEVSFSLKNMYGNANVKMKTYSEEDFHTAVAAGNSPTETGLDSVANYYQINPDLPAGASIVKKELVQKGGSQAYKFTVSQRILGVDTQFYQYLTVSSNKYYVVTANYPSSLPTVSSQAESLVDSFSFYSADKSVRGASDRKESGLQILDAVKIAELTKPSVVNIVTVYCNDVVVNDTTSLKYLKSSYKYCDGAKGSGFFISEKGYVATNGHVVKIYPEMSFVTGIETASLKYFLVDLVKELAYQREDLDINDEQAMVVLLQVVSDPQTFQALLVGMYDFLDKKILSIKEGQTRYFVKLGNRPIMFDEEKIKSGDILNAVKASGEIKEAVLVSYDFPNILSVDAVLRKSVPQGSDVAIIKLMDSSLSFPALKLGDSSSLRDGSQLIVVGYPGLVEGTQADKASLVNYQSSAQPTITRGVVSSIKMDNSGKKLVQTDASIDHGNSGGPAINENGEVVGLATYGFESQSGNYNFLRDIADLKALASRNNVVLAESLSYKNWENGLFYFWDSYYRKSVKAFNLTKQEYPIHPSVDTFISDAQVAIEKGKDRSGILGAVTDVVPPIVLIGVFGLVFVVGAGGIIFLIIKRRKSQVSGPVISGSYVAPVPVAQQPIVSPVPPVVAAQVPPPLVQTPPPQPPPPAAAVVTNPAPVVEANISTAAILPNSNQI